jgi:hypothetical protein
MVRAGTDASGTRLPRAMLTVPTQILSRSQSETAKAMGLDFRPSALRRGRIFAAQNWTAEGSLGSGRAMGARWKHDRSTSESCRTTARQRFDVVSQFVHTLPTPLSNSSGTFCIIIATGIIQLLFDTSPMDFNKDVRLVLLISSGGLCLMASGRERVVSRQP